MLPRTDIICLVHNQLHITKQFVKHLFNNTANFHLIFIDNDSTDGTDEFLNEGKKNNRWEVISPGENLGVIKGRNLGAQHIKSDYFLNIDNDQLVQKGWLESLFQLMNRNDIVGCEAWELMPPKSSGALVMNGQIVSDRSYFPYKHCKYPNDTFTYIGCGGCLIKKKVYDSIGLFDERFSPAYFEDPDFGFRAILAGFKLGWCHNCPIIHLEHQTFNTQQLFNKNTQFQKSWKAFRDKWSPYFPKSMKIPKG